MFIGDSKARTFDFHAGDTGVFPDNSGKYTSPFSQYRVNMLNLFKRTLYREHLRDRETRVDRALQERPRR